jgi:hypothetical protein
MAVNQRLRRWQQPFTDQLQEVLPKIRSSAIKPEPQ